ncbi:hypothetical protein [Rubritalea sp.]|uniref:hypothetical protein n=1 Tax=Rubritalea sp. TaxID=2109375 RepID=UPI003EF4B066
MSTQTSTLAPAWARIIHRLSSLGVVETSYSNTLASHTEVGTYPRHIISAHEHSSQSIDGSTQWNFLNWQQGWIQRRQIQHAVENKFHFSSKKNTIFHQLRFLETTPNECLNCLLQLFSSGEDCPIVTRAPQPKKSGPHWRKISHILEHALATNRSNNTIKLTLYTEGGIIQKLMKGVELTESKGAFTLSDGKHNSIRLDSANIAHLQTKHQGKYLQTTLYNSQLRPQAVLKHCA